MAYIKLPSSFPKEQYIWLKNYADKLGESMVSIVRMALREYKERIERKN